MILIFDICYDEQEYAWVKRDQIFSFADNVDRYTIFDFCFLISTY